MILLLKHSDNSTRFEKKVFTILRKVYNFDFSYLMGMKLDKSYVKVLKKKFTRVKISTQIFHVACYTPCAL